MSNQKNAVRGAVAAAVALALIPFAALADSPRSPWEDYKNDWRDPSREPTLDIRKIGAIATPGAEISAFDPQSRRIFTTDATGKKVHIIDASNPARLLNVGVIDVAAFDITRPSTPVFMQYVNDRLEGAPELRDLGPEGMEFIPAKDSPTREPLLILTSEVSNTGSVYSLVDYDRR